MYIITILFSVLDACVRFGVFIDSYVAFISVFNVICVVCSILWLMLCFACCCFGFFGCVCLAGPLIPGPIHPCVQCKEVWPSF